MLMDTTRRTTLPRRSSRALGMEPGEVENRRAAGDARVTCMTERFLTIRAQLLSLLEKCDLRSEAGLGTAVELIREAADCRGAAVRLSDEDGYAPFEAQRGFPGQYCARRNLLSLSRDRCLCAQILTETVDPACPARMPGGALVFGTSAEMAAVLESLPEPPAHLFCPEPGFESFALIPIRGAGFPLGLVHCADPRPHRFPPLVVEQVEILATDIGRTLFFDSIWPSPWAGADSAMSPALCPMCGRRRTHAGGWEAPEWPGHQHVRWSVRPARRALCPQCLASQMPV